IRADLLNASAVQSSAADGLVVADGLLLALAKEVGVGGIIKIFFLGPMKSNRAEKGEKKLD
ncbi:hypothetical protein Tco_0029609, partial [Tanacetum coccineum]